MLFEVGYVVRSWICCSKLDMLFEVGYVARSWIYCSKLGKVESNALIQCSNIQPLCPTFDTQVAKSLNKTLILEKPIGKMLGKSVSYYLVAIFVDWPLP